MMSYVSIISCFRECEIKFIHYVVDTQKLTPTVKRCHFESAHQAAYIPATVQDQILIFKAVDNNRSSFFQDWKSHVETHGQNTTINFKNYERGG